MQKLRFNMSVKCTFCFCLNVLTSWYLKKIGWQHFKTHFPQQILIYLDVNFNYLFYWPTEVSVVSGYGLLPYKRRYIIWINKDHEALLGHDVLQAGCSYGTKHKHWTLYRLYFGPVSYVTIYISVLLHYWLIQKYSTPGETKIIPYLHLSWQNNLCSMLFINKMGAWVKITLWNLYSWRMFSFYRLKYPCQIRSEHCYWCPVSLYCKGKH